MLFALHIPQTGSCCPSRQILTRIQCEADLLKSGCVRLGTNYNSNKPCFPHAALRAQGHQIQDTETAQKQTSLRSNDRNLHLSSCTNQLFNNCIYTFLHPSLFELLSILMLLYSQNNIWIHKHLAWPKKTPTHTSTPSVNGLRQRWSFSQLSPWLTPSS